MKKLKLLAVNIFLSFIFCGISSAQQTTESERITTRIDTTQSGGLIMIQEFTVDAPIDKAWQAYTTEEGWKSWAVPIAEVDFKINGTIKTNYNPNGTIGDSTTIVTHVLNYVPKRLITLQAEITENFPAFMKEDEKDLYNVIEFEETGESQIKIISYGIGYKNTQKYQDLMGYFVKANEESLLQLIRYLEKAHQTD